MYRHNPYFSFRKFPLIVRKTVLATLLLLANLSIAQNLESRISNVENGLTFQATTPIGGEIVTGNILEKFKQYKVNGGSIAVINDGKIEWSKAYGVADVNSGNPVSTKMLFQCASIGKVITALAILHLVQEGKVELDEPVNNKLIRWKISANDKTEIEAVTLRHLLSHSAGLTDDYGFLGYEPTDQIPNLLQVLQGVPPATTKKSLAIKTVPGQVERYSGAGYLIIQLLIEDVTEISFDDYVQQKIFVPLGMTNTTYDHQPDKNLGKPIASGHNSNGKALNGKKYHVYPEKAAAGPWTTAEDLARLVVGIQDAFAGKDQALWSQQLITDFLTPQINHKGLGVNLKGVDKVDAFWHAGQNLGYTSLLYGLADQKQGAVVLLNSDGGDRLMQEIVTSIAHEYQWPVMQSYRATEIPPDLQTKLIGKYENRDKSKGLIVELKKKKLYLRPTSAKRGYELLKIGENHYTFRNAQDYFKLTFESTGGETTLSYTEGIGNTMQFKRARQ